MTARDELIEAFIQDNWNNPLFSLEKCGAWVDQVLNRHAAEVLAAVPPVVSVSTENFQVLLDRRAHELAEKIMALRSTIPDLKAGAAWKAGYEGGLMVAALTIDPEDAE